MPVLGFLTVSAAQAFPVSVENCGSAIDLEAKPERIIALGRNAVELVLSAGAADQLMGYSTENGSDDLLPELRRHVLEKIPFDHHDLRLSEISDLEPDLVVASWGNGFSTQTSINPGALSLYGIKAYALTGSCTGIEQRQPSISDGLRDLELIGQILDGETETTRLSGELSAEIKALSRRAETAEPVSFLALTNDADGLQIAGNASLPAMTMTAMGGINLGGEQDFVWRPFDIAGLSDTSPEIVMIVGQNQAVHEVITENLLSSLEDDSLRIQWRSRLIYVESRDLEPSVRSTMTLWRLNEIMSEHRGL